MGRLNRGDIVIIRYRPDAAADPAARGPHPDALGLVEWHRRGSARARVWIPFVAGAGAGRFQVAVDRLAVIGHIHLLDAATVTVRTDREWRSAIPLLAALDRPRRARPAFLAWYFEAGPGTGQDVDWDTLLALSEF